MYFSTRFACVSLAVFAMLSQEVALAQGEITLPVPGVHQVGLLLIPNVQNELKLEGTQVAEAGALAGRVQAFMIKSIQELQAKPLQERVPGLEAMNARLVTDTKAGLAAFLKEPQLARLRQISLQERGGMSFAESEVQDHLKMSDNQKARVRSQVTEVFLKMRQLAAASPIDARSATEKSLALRKELAETILGEMTEEQRAFWKEMIGAPFEVKFPQSPRPSAPPAAPAAAGPTPR